MAEQRTRRPHGPMGGPGRGMMPGESQKISKTLSKNWFVISEDTGMQSLPL